MPSLELPPEFERLGLVWAIVVVIDHGEVRRAETRRL
jgi:hypothetical protein